MHLHFIVHPLCSQKAPVKVKGTILTKECLCGKCSVGAVSSVGPLGSLSVTSTVRILSEGQKARTQYHPPGSGMHFGQKWNDRFAARCAMLLLVPVFCARKHIFINCTFVRGFFCFLCVCVSSRVATRREFLLPFVWTCVCVWWFC